MTSKFKIGMGLALISCSLTLLATELDKHFSVSSEVRNSDKTLTVTKKIIYLPKENVFKIDVTVKNDGENTILIKKDDIKAGFTAIFAATDDGNGNETLESSGTPKTIPIYKKFPIELKAKDTTTFTISDKLMQRFDYFSISIYILKKYSETIIFKKK